MGLLSLHWMSHAISMRLQDGAAHCNQAQLSFTQSTHSICRIQVRLSATYQRYIWRMSTCDECVRTDLVTAH